MKKIILVLMLFPLMGFGAAKNQGTSSGRFQLIQLSDFRRDQFLIDTQSGQLWRITCAVQANSGGSAECGFSYWSEEIVEGKNATSKQIGEMIQRVNEANRKE